MRNLRRSLAVSKITSLILMVALCSGLVAGVAATAAPPPGGKGKSVARGNSNKISSDLRGKMKGSGKEDKSGKGGSEKVQAILQLEGKPTGRLNSLLNRNGVHINGQFDQLNMVAVELPLDVVEELASFSEVSYLSLDREVVSLSSHLSMTTGADAVRQQTTSNGASYTLDGTGIGIAFLDSGIYSAHKSFTGRIAAGRDYTGEGRLDDPYGHGSHVASIAAGNGSISKGKYIGIAPNATIYNLRVLNSKGTGTVSGVLAALDDLLKYHAHYNIRVVNMSLGMPAIDSYKDDPVCKAVRRLVDAGLVVVVAAGNDGKNVAGEKAYGLIHAPGNEPSAITVGASNTVGTVDRADDVMTTYSSRGPTRSYRTDAEGAKHYDNLIKPDLVAPGNKIIAAEAVSNYLVKTNPSLDAGVSKFDTQKMMRLNGTSMATPVVAGTAALLLQLNPQLTPNMIKAILMYTAQPLSGYNMFEQGAGQVNIEGAIRLAKSMHTDQATAMQVGAPMLTTAAPPQPQTTITFNSTPGRNSSTTFSWSQGIILDRAYATGTDLITKYQAIYGKGVLLGDGVLFSDGVLISDTTMLSNGVLFGDQIVTSRGITMSEGTPFLSAGVLYSDGVLISDGVLFGDGVLISDGVLFGDSVIFSDYAVRAQTAILHGDHGPDSW